MLRCVAARRLPQVSTSIKKPLTRITPPTASSIARAESNASMAPWLNPRKKHREAGNIYDDEDEDEDEDNDNDDNDDDDEAGGAVGAAGSA